MFANESMNDRYIRSTLGLAAIIVFLMDPRPLWAILGVLLVFSGLSGHSLLYRAFDYSTIEVKHSNKRLLLVLMISGVFVGLAAMAVVFSGASTYLWQVMMLGTAGFAASYGAAMGYFCGKTCASN